MAVFLVEGRSLVISGGSIRFSSGVYCCRHCRAPFKWAEESDFFCPRCGESNAIHAHAACNGSCVCCEEKEKTPLGR
jgi:predicted amidophosphoribosyltransferase